MPSWFQSVSRFEDPMGAARIATFVDLLQRFPTGHLVDLGAGHGVFSRIAASLGWRVTAVDVREVRFPDDEDVRWVVSDVRDFDAYDDVDVVACLGLWYHLTLDDQRQLAARIAPRPLILDTHVALPTEVQGTRSLTGGVVEHDGLIGRFYDESKLQHEPTASWGNLASFWPSLPSLEKQMYDAGYDLVERYEPAHTKDRGFFVARTLGGSAAQQRIVEQIERFNQLTDPDAKPLGRLISLTPELTPEREPAVSPAPAPAPAGPLPIRDAARQFATAARASGRRKVGQARRTWRRRVSSRP